MTANNNYAVGFLGTGYYLPEKVLTNADLEYKYLADADFVESVNELLKELLDAYEFTDEDL